jgi:hypothetical protein
MKKDKIYLYVLTSLFFVVSFIGILHHELWLDEAHHWLLARDSNSFTNLNINTRSEGHPLLWSILLYGITRITTNPFWMQFLHILISTSFVFVFLKKAPFNWVIKTLFIFGYFIIFEYNLISRNYNLGILFLFLACTIFKERKNRFILISFYLAMASNTHLMFSVIAFALFVIIVFEQIENKQVSSTQNTFGYLIFGLGLISILIQIQTTNSGWLLNPIEKIPFSERLIKGFISFFKGLITIPDFRTIHFWNSNLIVDTNRKLASIFALLIYFLPLVLFSKNKKTLYFVYMGLIGTQIFFFVTQRAATRFHGMTYIIFIIALWIENYYPIDNYKLKDFLISLKLTLFKKQVVYCILIIQFCSGIYAYSMDLIYPFSSAKETIDFTKKSYQGTEIISLNCEGTLLSAYLEKKIYFLCNQSFQSFCHWDFDCSGNMTKQKTIQMLTDYIKKNNNILYISYYSLGNEKNKNWVILNSKIKARFIKKFDENIVEKSNYYIFEISKI